jgi:hypothetical protein
MPRMIGDIDFWSSQARRTIALGIRRYGLRVLLLLVALRVLWILSVHIFK